MCEFYNGEGIRFEGVAARLTCLLLTFVNYTLSGIVIITTAAVVTNVLHVVVCHIPKAFVA